MIGYAQPTSCHFTDTMDCNGNSLAHQQRSDQHVLQDRCPELAKLLDMDVQTSAIAQLHRVAVNHLPDVPERNQSLPQISNLERAVSVHHPLEPRSNVLQERFSRSHSGSPSVCNNSVTTCPYQSGTTTSPSISDTKVSSGPVIPLVLKKVTEGQTTLQNGAHVQTSEIMQSERPYQNGWPNRIRRAASEIKEAPSPGKNAGIRDQNEMEVTKEKENKSQQPASPIDLSMSCDEEELDGPLRKMNDQYGEALRKYHQEMARYRDELEKHFIAKHGLDEKTKAESSRLGPDVILISRGVQASEVTERDTLIAPAIELDLASGDQSRPSSPDSRAVINTTQTKMRLSHSAPRNRFQRHFGNLVTYTTASSDALLPSDSQNNKSPHREITLSPLMSPASSSSQTPPQCVISNHDGEVPGMAQRDKRIHPIQMQLPRFPSSNASCVGGINSQFHQLPPPLCQSDEDRAGGHSQQCLQPFSLVQPPIYSEIPHGLRIPGQVGRYPPPYPAGQTATRPPHQVHPSESGSSESDPPANGQVHPLKRRCRSSSGSRQAKRPKAQEVTLNTRVNVSQSGHTVSYRPEDQVAAHFEETYNKISQRSAKFSPPNVSVRHPWQPSMSPYSGGMKQNSQQSNTRPTHSLLRDHLMRQPRWPFGQAPPHHGTVSRMLHPFHQDFTQLSQHPGGGRMPRPFLPECYNGHPPVNHIGPFAGLDRSDINAGYRNQGMPPYFCRDGDKTQPHHPLRSDLHPSPTLGQSSPTYLPSEGAMQMFNGMLSCFRLPDFPLNGQSAVGRPDGMPNLTPTSEPSLQSLSSKAHRSPNLLRDNSVKNLQPSVQGGSALTTNDSFGSRTGPLHRYSTPERAQSSMISRPVSQDDRNQRNSLSQSSDVLDLSQPHQQEVMPQISKVNNVNKQRSPPADMVRRSPPQSQRQEPVIPKIVSVTTERREPYPPTAALLQGAVHHGKNQVVKTTCPPLVPVSQVSPGPLSSSGMKPNKELVAPSIGKGDQSGNSDHSLLRPHHQPSLSCEAVSVSEATTLSQNRILSVPRLVRDERGVHKVVACREENSASPRVAVPSKDVPRTMQETAVKVTTSVQPGVLTSTARREVNQTQQASSKTNSASAISNYTLSAKQQPMPALLRIPKIRKSALPERNEMSLSSTTTTTTSNGNKTSISKQRDAAGITQRTTAPSSGGGLRSAIQTHTNVVSGKNVSVPHAVPQTSSLTLPRTIVTNLVTSQVSTEMSMRQNPSGPVMTGISEAFLAAFPSLCSQPPTVPTSAPILSSGPATQQNQVILAAAVPSQQSLLVPAVLAQPIVIPTSVSNMSGDTVDQHDISLPSKEVVSHPQVVAGTVRSVAEESTQQKNAVDFGILRNRTQLEGYLDQVTVGASGSKFSGTGGGIPAVDSARIESGGMGATPKEKVVGSDACSENESQLEVQKEVETHATHVTSSSNVITSVPQETEDSEEEVITIAVASVSSSPEVSGSKDESKNERQEDVNIFDQVATFVSSLEKRTDSSATTNKCPEEKKLTASHSSSSGKAKHQLNGYVPTNMALDGTVRRPTVSPSGRLKNCTLRLVPRRRSGDEEKAKEKGQLKPVSHTTEGKKRKNSHRVSSARKEKFEPSISSKWKKYYGFKKGRLPSHQHNTRFRVVCYHCEKLMADNITYMDHVEEVIEKSCPVSKIKKLCKICFKAPSGDLQQHIKESHLKGRKHVCHICNVNFPKRKDHKTHMKKIHKGLTMPYICKICLYQTSFHADLKYHFITAHRGSKALLCHFCTKVLYSSRSFLSHFTKHYARQIGVQCPDCKLLFLSNSSCKEHMNNDHQKFEDNDKDGLPPYKSFYLPKVTPPNAQGCTKPLGSVSSLNEKVIVVPDEEEGVKKAWKCLECGGSYVHLAEHLFTEYKCQNCPYVTHCSSAFTQHVVAFHSSFQDAPTLHPVKKSRVFGGQLLRCRKCGYKTAFATNMAKHIVCCPEGISVIDSFDYLRTRALKEIAMRGRIADNSDNVPEVIAVENIQ